MLGTLLKFLISPLRQSTVFAVSMKCVVRVVEAIEFISARSLNSLWILVNLLTNNQGEVVKLRVSTMYYQCSEPFISPLKVEYKEYQLYCNLYCNLYSCIAIETFFLERIIHFSYTMMVTCCCE